MAIRPDASPWSYVEPYKEHIVPPYAEEYRTGYRWVHQPLMALDGKPQAMQSSEPVKSVAVPGDDADAMVWMQYAESFTVSSFDTPDNARLAYQEQIRRFRAQTSNPLKAERKIQSFRQNKGEYIQKVDYTPDTALVGPVNEHGHFNAILKEGVELADLVDPDFTPLKIDIE